jgi:hypothetical protein
MTPLLATFSSMGTGSSHLLPKLLALLVSVSFVCRPQGGRVQVVGCGRAGPAAARVRVRIQGFN